MKDFRDYQYDPADLDFARRSRNLTAEKLELGFRVVEDKDSDPRYPWDRPPLLLRGQMLCDDGSAEDVVLLPMGSTILRRTFFDEVKD